MSNPKSPAASRILAANSLIDRGWGKAAQLVDVQGDVKHLLEVKLTVVEPSHALPNDPVITLGPNDIKELANNANSKPDSSGREPEPK